MKKTTLLSITSAACFATVCNAAVIADYNFSGYTGGDPSGTYSTTDSLDSNITSTSVVVAGALEEGGNGSYTGELNMASWNLTTAGLTINLVVADGFELDLDSVVLNIARNGTGASDTFELNLGATQLATIGTGVMDIHNGGSGAMAGSPTHNEAFALTGVSAAQNLTGSIALTIDDLDGLAGNVRMNDLVVNGTITAVPEPSSTALLGLGGLALIMRRRK